MGVQNEQEDVVLMGLFEGMGKDTRRTGYQEKATIRFLTG